MKPGRLDLWGSPAGRRALHRAIGAARKCIRRYAYSWDPPRRNDRRSSSQQRRHGTQSALSFL